MNERYWIQHEENRSNDIRTTELVAKNKDKHLKKVGFAWKQLSVSLMKLIATLTFCGCCVYLAFYILSLMVSNVWSDWTEKTEQKENQLRNYSYQAIVQGETGKYLTSYPKCYTTEHYLACETDNGIEEIVEDYWEK